MRVDIKQTNVYTFDELSDEAKAKARDWLREGYLDYDWWDSVYEAAETAGALLGITLHRERKNSPTIYFSGFCNQGDGARFEGSYSYRPGWRKALLSEFPLSCEDSLHGVVEIPGRRDLLDIGERLQEAQARHFYRLEATCTATGRGEHSGCMAVEVVDGYSLYRDIGDAEDDVRDALRLFADWIYDCLEREHDYLLSDESMDESIRSNEYEFTEAGEIYS